MFLVVYADECVLLCLIMFCLLVVVVWFCSAALAGNEAASKALEAPVAIMQAQLSTVTDLYMVSCVTTQHAAQHSAQHSSCAFVNDLS